MRFPRATHLVIGFEDKGDAERVMDALGKRLEHFGLTLHPGKTHLLPFRRPPGRQQGGKGQATFDFLGFTFFWTRTRRGRWAMRCKTRSARLRRLIRSVSEWCRRHRHLPVAVQHRALKRRIQGHLNYFGVSGNFRALQLVIAAVRKAWFKWLCRRSQRKRLTWERFVDLLRGFPFPKPRILVAIWGSYNHGNFGDDVMAVLFARAVADAGATPVVFRMDRDLARRYEIATEDELGGAEMHASVSGLAEYLAENDGQAVQMCRELLHRLQWNNGCAAPNRRSFSCQGAAEKAGGAGVVRGGTRAEHRSDD